MRVDEYLTRITPFGFAGTCLVARGDDVVLARGYGLAHRVAGVENSADTVLSLGSITKQFTAAAILKLEERGELTTDDPIARFLEAPADKAEVTLHELLTHTSGLVDATGEDYDACSRDEAVRLMLAAPLLFPAGSGWAYSNAGYSLLATIVELVSGTSYEQFLAAELLRPAGLMHTGYRLPAWHERDVAHWYDDGDWGTPLEKQYPSWHLVGNGDMLSTAPDMCRWIRALRDRTVLGEHSLTKLFTPTTNEYGYGWRVTSGEHGVVVEHGGASGCGSSAQLTWFRDIDELLVLMCNRAHAGSPLAPTVADNVLAALRDDEVTLPPAAERPEPPLPHGFIELDGGARIAVEVRAHELCALATGQRAIDLVAWGGERHDDLNDSGRDLLARALAGDIDALAVAADADTARRERFRTLVRAEDAAEVDGAITIPSHVRGAAETRVVLSRGDAIGLHFANGRLLGLTPAQPQTSVALPIARVGRDYATYHLGSERLATLDLQQLP